MYNFLTTLLICTITLGFSGCGGLQDDDGRQSDISDIVDSSESAYYNTVTTTVTIHNPTTANVTLINRTRLKSQSGRIYRLVGTTHIPASQRIKAKIQGGYLAGKTILTFPGLSGSKFESLYAEVW